MVADAVAAGGGGHVEDAADTESQRGIREGLHESAVGEVVSRSNEGAPIRAVGGAQGTHDVSEGHLGR